MNPEIKSKWVAALRSGEYKQGKGVLSDGKEFCCLGVLCDLAVKEGGVLTIGVDTSMPDELDETSVIYDGYQFDLPPSVMGWAGLDASNPKIQAPGDEGKAYISDVNDGGTSFEEIADLIEKEL